MGHVDAESDQCVSYVGRCKECIRWAQNRGAPMLKLVIFATNRPSEMSL